MTAYKRPDLLFTDRQRFKTIAVQQPLQIALAGRAHPCDQDGKRTIEARHAHIRELAGAVPAVFLPNQGIHHERSYCAFRRLGPRRDHDRGGLLAVLPSLRPKTWREWASAGVVQAFIISLYAEMYGFPLTIYLLTRFFGLDRYNLSASLWSSIVGLGETRMLISMLLGYALLFIGIGIFIQGWRELYRAHRANRLATDGLYGLVRHPQYTGLFIGLFGEGVVHWPTLFSVGLFPVIVLAYTWLARSEEKKVLQQFGEEYRAYRTSKAQPRQCVGMLCSLS